MKLLLKKVKIIAPRQALNGKTMDILIEKGKISAIEENLSSNEAEELQDVMYTIEDDYLDTFLGVSAVISKMSQEIEEKLLPIAPKIMSQTKKISDSGWSDMETARLGAESRVNSTRTLIIVLGIVAIALGMLIGFISSTRAATAEGENERQRFLQTGQTELNEKTREWADRRDELNSKVRKLIEEANAKREMRDKLNAEVKAAKVKRDEWNRKYNDLSDKLVQLKREKMPKSGQERSLVNSSLRDWSTSIKRPVWPLPSPRATRTRACRCKRGPRETSC